MEPLSLLVARLPRTKRSEQIRRHVRQILAPHTYLRLQLADEVQKAEMLRPLIDQAFLVLVDISRSRDMGAFLDLGYALGQGKFCVALAGPKPADTGGFTADITVSYRHASHLRELMQASLVEWVGRAIHKYTAEGQVFANMDARLLAPLGSHLLEQDLEDEFTVAADHGFSEEQVGISLEVLRGLGLAQSTEDGWTMTPRGRTQLPILLAWLNS